MNHLKELREIKALTHFQHELIDYFELDRINYKSNSYPIIGFKIGSDDPKAPCLGLFGGVHGLEKIGTHVIISYLSSLFNQLTWDKDLNQLLTKIRIVSIPLINPAGMAHHYRCNPNGIDLMRNSPIDAVKRGSHFLVSGHRVSSKLPWYRGEKGAPLEKEVLATCDFVKKYMFTSKTALAMDFHSGFGFRDRLWYPYAKSSEEFPKIKEVQNLIDLLNETLPHHIYKIEPQSASYTINGDLWDYLFEEHRLGKEYQDNLFIPWTMEMGSWNWVKKNPLQIFSAHGLFNPMKDHRYGRTMRRHLLLIDFLLRAIRNPHAWE